jgi:hypothetical protein
MTISLSLYVCSLTVFLVEPSLGLPVDARTHRHSSSPINRIRLVLFRRGHPLLLLILLLQGSQQLICQRGDGRPHPRRIPLPQSCKTGCISTWSLLTTTQEWTLCRSSLPKYSTSTFGIYKTTIFMPEFSLRIFNFINAWYDLCRYDKWGRASRTRSIAGASQQHARR